MIILLLISLYIFFTTVSFGILTRRLFNKCLKTDHLPALFSADLLSILGLVTIGTFLNFFSLFFRIGTILPHLLIVSVALSSVVAFHDDWKTALKPAGNIPTYLINLILILPFMLNLVQLAVQGIAVYDTGLYHSQAVRWIENFGCLPGLGNLAGRLAFNSSFFVLSAFYGFSFVAGKTYYVVNLYLVLLFTATALLEIKRSAQSRDYPQLFILVFVLIFTYFLSELYISSLSPDLAPIVMVFYLFILTARNRQSLLHLKFLLPACWLAAFLVTIKLSYMPPILFIIGYLALSWKKGLQWRLLLPIAIIVVLLPWIIRNIILSGYLIYPLPEVDLFSFDWKIPAASAAGEKMWIKAWAIARGASAEEVLARPVSDWLPEWFHDQSPVDRFSLIVSLVSPAAVFALYKLNRMDRHLVFFSLICFGALVLWFISAPDVRFAYGFLYFCATITLSPLALPLKHIKQHSIITWTACALLVVFALWQTSLIYLESRGQPFAEFLVQAPQVRRVPVVQKQARNLYVFVPVWDDRCFNAPLPCTPSLNPALEMRGTELSSGFRIVSSDLK